MSANAKLAYMLSVCHKLNDGIMTVMTKQYEKSRTVATRHYFNFHINFYEPPTSANFEVKNTYLQFAQDTSSIIIEALQYHNNKILCEKDMLLIYNNLVEQGIKLNAYQLVAIYSIATLIKLYKSRGFKYIFTPVVINYGRDNHLLHQTALIIDISGDACKVIYYEPYGKYTKYNKSYRDAVGKLFHCFNGFSCFKEPVTYTTYHEMLEIQDGIQQILLTKNNLRVGDFEKKLSDIINKLKKEFPTENFLKNFNEPGAQDTSDKTVAVLDLVFNFDFFDITNLSSEKKKIYYEILDTILTQYCCFNSKTCVSITIVEMDKFFKFSQESNYDLTIVKSKMVDMYQLYLTNTYPNNILMTEIYMMLDLFKYSKQIKELMDGKTQPNVICKKLK